MNRQKLLGITRFFSLFVLFLFFLPLLAGCAQAAEARGADAPAPNIDLEGSSWTLSQLGDASILPDGAPTLHFAGDQVQGHGTCNGFFGPFERDGTRLSFGPLASTMMACPGMDQETAYLAALAEATAFRLEGETLVLSNEKGDLLAFAPTPALPLEGTAWRLVSLKAGAAMTPVLNGTEITALLAGDRVSGSAGCNRYQGALTVEGDALSAGSLAGTRMFCAEPAGLMEQEAAYMAALGGAARFEVEGQTLTLWDDEGTRVLVYTAASE